MPVDRLARPGDIRAALPQVMASHDRLSSNSAVAALRGLGLRLPADRDDAVDMVLTAIDGPDPDDPTMFVVAGDDEIVALAQVMAGRILTHRLGPAEAADDTLVIDTDLPGLAFDHLQKTGLTLADGTTVGVFEGQETTWLGELMMALPPGTYAALGVAAGDLVGIHFAAGAARLVAVADLDPAAASAVAVADALRRQLQASGPTTADLPADELFLNTRCFTEPVAPLTEICRANGIHIQGELLAASADQARQHWVARLTRQIASDYEFPADTARVVAEIVHLANRAEATLTDSLDPQDLGLGDLDPEDHLDSQAGEGPDPAKQPKLAERLVELDDWISGPEIAAWLRVIADPDGAMAIAGEALDNDEVTGLGLAWLAAALRVRSRATGRDRARDAGLDYLEGRALEGMGDPLAAEPCFQRASTAADHPYALLSLAGIAADRGQVAAATSLLDRAGAPPTHPLRAALGAASRPVPGRQESQRKVGRNEPCWCGSGRKFKVCHARASATPLPDRSQFLLGRAAAWLMVNRGGSVRAMIQLAAMVSDGRAPVEQLAQFVPDVLLLEGGGLADYVALRGPLLAPDEELMAGQWALGSRSLYQVEQVSGRQSLRLRDLLTGDRVAVLISGGAEQLSAGELVVTRVADVGGHLEAFGGLAVIGMSAREGAIELLSGEPDPMSVISFLARRWAGPQLQTPEGDEALVTTSKLRTTAPVKLRRELDKLCDRAGQDSWTLLVPGEADHVLADLTLDGKELTVTAMSPQRLELALEALSGVPVALVESEYEELDPGDTDVPERTSGGGQIDPTEHPEVLQAVAEYIAKAEREWVDESIPALGGLTPKQALLDPTRRDDLIQLLASWPDDGSLLQMDGGRIRAMLGLENPR